jgi:hypothetical protein
VVADRVLPQRVESEMEIKARRTLTPADIADARAALPAPAVRILWLFVAAQLLPVGSRRPVAAPSLSSRPRGKENYT